MADQSIVYNAGLQKIMNGAIDLDTTALKVLLVDNDYTPNKDDEFVSATGLASNELSGTGYVSGFSGAGRKALASKVVAKDNTNDRATFDAADLTWTGISAGNAKWAILYKPGSADSDSDLLCCFDLRVDVAGGWVTNGGDLTIQWDAVGLLKMQQG